MTSNPPPAASVEECMRQFDRHGDAMWEKRVEDAKEARAAFEAWLTRLASPAYGRLEQALERLYEDHLEPHYLGGHKSAETIDAFQHGMKTAANVVQSMLEVHRARAAGRDGNPLYPFQEWPQHGVQPSSPIQAIKEQLLGAAALTDSAASRPPSAPEPAGSAHLNTGSDAGQAGEYGARHKAYGGGLPPARAGNTTTAPGGAAEPGTSPPLSAAAAEGAAWCAQCGADLVYASEPSGDEPFARCFHALRAARPDHLQPTPPAPVAHVHRFDDGVCRCGLEWKLMHTDPTLWAVDDGCGGVAHVRVPAAPVARETAADPDGERIMAMAAEAGLTVEEWVRQFNAAPIIARGGTLPGIKIHVMSKPGGSAIQDLCTTLIGCGHWSAPSAQLALKELAELREDAADPGRCENCDRTFEWDEHHPAADCSGDIAFCKHCWNGVHSDLRSKKEDIEVLETDKQTLLKQRADLNDQIGGLSKMLCAAEAKLKSPPASPGGAGAVERLLDELDQAGPAVVLRCAEWHQKVAAARAEHQQLQALAEGNETRRREQVAERDATIMRLRGEVDALRGKLAQFEKRHALECGEIKTLDGIILDLRKRLQAAEKLAAGLCADHTPMKAELVKSHEREQMLRDERAETVWLWQGDGGDNLESLVCPVLIQPDALRLLLCARGHALPFDVIDTMYNKVIATFESKEAAERHVNTLANCGHVGYEIRPSPPAQGATVGVEELQLILDQAESPLFTQQADIKGRLRALIARAKGPA